ncbi:hypothetical protein BX285_6756 [Streptomyces sp. 1114.5]|nr:hypothetical protein BX285_6756 [Streptomyces sp. 1114.5]
MEESNTERTDAGLTVESTGPVGPVEPVELAEPGGPVGPVGPLGQTVQMSAEDLSPAGGCGCGCGHGDGSARAQPAYLYAVGRVEPRFPTLGVEKEFAQVLGRADVAGLTDREALQAVLSEQENRYLARQLCWILTIEGLETYLLRPRDPADLSLLVEAVRPRSDGGDVDVVIGTVGPIAPPEVCNGLMVPTAVVDQIYSFDRDTLLASLPVPKGADADRFRSAAAEVFDRVVQLSDNAGATDEHRALNYLAVRYPAIYARAAEAFDRNQSITAVEVRPSRLGGARTVVDVVFSYTGRDTDVTEKAFARVDVTERHPFLVTRLQPYYDR